MRLLMTRADDGSAKYYAGGRRVTRQRYHELHGAANRTGRLSCSLTVRKGGRWHHSVEA